MCDLSNKTKNKQQAINSFSLKGRRLDSTYQQSCSFLILKTFLDIPTYVSYWCIITLLEDLGRVSQITFKIVQTQGTGKMVSQGTITWAAFKLLAIMQLALNEERHRWNRCHTWLLWEYISGRISSAQRRNIALFYMNKGHHSVGQEFCAVCKVTFFLVSSVSLI